LGQQGGWNYSQKRELQTGETSGLRYDRNRYESVNSVKDGIPKEGDISDS